MILQKVQTTPNFLFLKFRAPGENIYISVGRGGKFCEMALESKMPNNFLRVSDAAIDFLKKHFLGKNLIGLELNSEIKRYNLDFLNEGKKDSLSLELKYENSTLQFLISKKKICLNTLSIEFLKNSIKKRDSLLFEEEFFKHLKEKEATKGKKKKEKKIKNIQQDLNKLRIVEELMPIVSSYYNNEFQNKNIFKYKVFELKLKSYDHFKNRNQILKKLGQYKKAISIQELRLEKLEDTEENVKNVNLKKYLKRIILPEIHKLKNNKNEIKVKKYNFFNTYFYIGLDAKSNDYLIHKFKKKKCIWFHVFQAKGPHGILITENLEKFDSQQINKLCSALLFFGHYEHQQLSVQCAAIENVKSLNKKGLVKVNKFSILKVQYDPSWLEELILIE